jgi:MarR family transcriptional regulator, negative regulator of the multidrug operon emrRAB
MSAHDVNVVGALGLALADRLAAAEASGSAAEALVALYGRSAGGSIDALARVLGLSHSGTVRLVDRLAAGELVERRRGADHRSAAVYLTPEGRRAARRVLATRATELHFALDVLTDDQQADLARLAGLVLGALGGPPGAERRLCRLCDLEACGRSRGRCPVAPARRR